MQIGIGILIVFIKYWGTENAQESWSFPVIFYTDKLQIVSIGVEESL